MLSDKEKEAMRAEGASVSRRNLFREMRRASTDKPMSGEEFFRFLDSATRLSMPPREQRPIRGPFKL